MSRFDPPKELLNSGPKITVVTQAFESQVEKAEQSPKGTTPGRAKNYFEFLQLVNKALNDYQTRENIIDNQRLRLAWEREDDIADTQSISVTITRREPGTFSQGAPFEGSVRNLRPVLREYKNDPDNPGYRIAVYGKWYDNLVKFTCWASTNAEAIRRSFWFEEFMEKYTWFFVISGVPRVLFMSQEEEVTVDNDGNKLYGRSLIYYVKTEKITTVSEKQLEEIYVSLSVEK